MKKRIPGELVLLVTAIIWGYGFVAVANSLDRLTPFQVVFLRFAISSVLLLLIFPNRFRQLSPSTWKKGALLGLFFFLGFLLQTLGMQYTTTSKSAFITGTNVIIVPLIAFFIFGRRLVKTEVLGSVLALLGLAILSLRLDGVVNLGDVLVLGCAVAFAFQVFYTTRFMQGESAVDITLVQILVCTALSATTALLEGTPLPPPEASILMPVLYLAVFSTAIATLTQSYGQQTTSATRSAILLSTESLWGSFFSFLILGEEMTLRIILGGVIIFSAILISELRPAKETLG